MSVNQQSFFLKSGGEHLACTALVPDNAESAVLMLPPFAEERKGALPFLLQLARSLYARNVASLLFDWRGSGDSSGEFHEITPDDYVEDLHVALSWLKQKVGIVPLTALGVRLSASFLLRQDLPDISNRILISPASGEEFLRQLLQRRMVNDMVAYGKAIESRASLMQKLQNGESVDLDGYIFSASWFSWAEKISEFRVQSSENQETEPPGSVSENTSPRIPHPVSRISTGSPPATCHLPLATLLIPGGHSPKTAKAIQEALPDTEVSELRFPPFWNTVGHVDLDELTSFITDWTAKHLTARQEPRPPVDCRIEAEAREGEAPAEPSSIDRLQLLNINAANATVRSIIDKPDSAPKAGILFLHGWSGDRTGPHRIFVQVARALTDEGFLCLRPDFRGRGLSDGEHGEASIASMAEDAAYALEQLNSLLPENTPLYVAAICSGCKVAITLAADHPEIAKMLLLSAESMGSLRSGQTDANKTKKALKTYLKKLTRPETWKKIVTGKVQTKMVTKALVRHETRSDDEAVAEDRTLKAFEQFRSPLHFVFGGSDPDAPGSMAAYKTYCETHGIPHTMHLVPHAGHSYYSVKWTEEVMETSLEFLTTENTE